jgi:hypothetical protein
LCDLDGTSLRADVLAQRDELVTSKARDRVAVADRFEQSRRQRCQHAIATVVAAQVVDALEVIEVDEHDRERSS